MDDLLKEIDDALDKASDGGVWDVEDDSGLGGYYKVNSHWDGVAKVYEPHDAHLIANAPTWLRKLRDEVIRLRDELEAYEHTHNDLMEGMQ